jgi:excisionase family DNA binding protein
VDNKDDQAPDRNAPTPRLSYKIKEAAQILGVSPVTVRRAIDRGLLKPCRAFRHTLISAEQLKKFINR